jgi:hypothetical protein
MRSSLGSSAVDEDEEERLRLQRLSLMERSGIARGAFQQRPAIADSQGPAALRVQDENQGDGEGFVSAAANLVSSAASSAIGGVRNAIGGVANVFNRNPAYVEDDESEEENEEERLRLMRLQLMKKM